MRLKIELGQCAVLSFINKMDMEKNPYESISTGLNTSLIGQKVLYYPRLTSTMGIARREAQRGAPDGTVILAGEQTKGRGRLKRSWLSPPGNIALSVILYPDIACLPCLVMLASLAVARSIEAVTGLKPQIKWPNDILIGGKKAGGILTESLVRKGRVVYAVIGIGINVDLKASDFPEIADIATSLNSELSGSVSPVDVVRHLLLEMERLYLTLPDTEAIYKEWRDRLVTLGESVCVTSGGSMLEGIAESVDRSGALILRHTDGSSTRIVAGDVTRRDK